MTKILTKYQIDCLLDPAAAGTGIRRCGPPRPMAWQGSCREHSHRTVMTLVDLGYFRLRDKRMRALLTQAGEAAAEELSAEEGSCAAK